MNIVFVSSMDGYSWGGSEELWSQAALLLRNSGQCVSASTVDWLSLSPKLTNMRSNGIHVQTWKPAWRISRLSRVGDRLRLMFGLKSRRLAWLIEQRPDLVVISQGGILDGLDWMELCYKAGIPFAVIVQCNHEGMWPSDYDSERMAEVYLAARKVYCVSRHNLKLLEYQIGNYLPNSEVVWNPFNLPVGPPPELPGSSDRWNFACVARLEPAAKGHDVLFEVLSSPKWQMRPVVVNLYGEGNGEAILRKLKERLNLANVSFRGYVRDVQSIWRENHLLVLPSRFEGLPLALVEAMLAARPAVVTDVGGNAELCLDGKTGFVAAAPVRALLDEALERAWRARLDWQQMGLTARERALELVPDKPAEIFCRNLLKVLEPQGIAPKF